MVNTMKKLAALLLSLVMCFSLLAIPAQAASIPDPDGSQAIDLSKGPGLPGGEDPDDPDDPDKPIIPGKPGSLPTPGRGAPTD